MFIKFVLKVSKMEQTKYCADVIALYEDDKIVLVEAKNSTTDNTIIRQLYYPFCQWQHHTNKKVFTLFFEKSKDGTYSIWQFEFSDPMNYNSIKLVKSGKFLIV